MSNIIITIIALVAVLTELWIMSNKSRYFKRETRMLKHDLERSQWLLKIENELLCLHISHKSVADFLADNGYGNIAIYGMGELGFRLSEEILLNSSANVMYGLDKNAAAISYVFPVYTLSKTHGLPKPDVILLTTYCENDNLKNLIVNETGCKVVSIEEVIDAVR